MKRFWRDMGVLAALALVSAPVMGHEPHISIAGASAGETEGTASQSSSTITIQTFQFKPAKLEVKAGTQVTWINQDDVPHNIVSSEGKTLKSPVLDTDQKFSYTFATAGTYPYYCGLHPKMTGKVIVQ